MAEEDTVLFKIYYEDKGKLSKLLNKVTAITTNGVEWGEPQKTKDERGEDCVYIRTKLTPAKNAKQIIKDIKILSNVVDCKAVQIKVVQPGYGNMNNIEVADNIPLVDPEYHDELMSYLDALKQRINLLGNYVTKVCKSEIRGRLSARLSDIPYVGKTCKLIGKIRFNEKDYSLQGNTTCGWYISRSNGPWNLVSETFEYTPLAEDAGCKVVCLVHFKGERHVFNASFVHIDRAYDAQLCTYVKKGKSLLFPCTTTTTFTDIELKKAGKKGGDDLQLTKNTLAFRRGRKVLFRADLGATAYVRTIRETSSTQCTVNIGGKSIVAVFRSPEECAHFVLLVRAYTAYDRLRLVLSLPKLPNLPEYNEVSYISPLIQGGFATMPYLWEEVPNVVPDLPAVSKKVITSVNAILSPLTENNTMDPVDYGLIAASLVPATRGAIEVNLPTEEIYTAEHEPEPEEPVEEEEVEIQFDPEMIIHPDGTMTPYIPGQPIPAGCRLADGSMPAPAAPAAAPAGAAVEMAPIKSIPELADAAPEGPFKLDKTAAEKLLSLFMKASPEGKPLPKEECYPMFDNAKLEPEIRDKVVNLIIGESSTITDGQYIAIIQILKQVKKQAPVPKTIPPELLPILPAAAAPAIPSKGKKPTLTKEEPAVEVDWTLSKAIQKSLTAQYKKACGEKSELANPMAMKLYKKSGVEPEVILQAINLVCGKKPATYEDRQFVVIMFILQKVTEGATVPTELPDALKEVLGMEVEKKNSPVEEPAEEGGDEWSIHETLWSKIETVFEKKANGEEKIAPDVAMKLFKKNEVEVPTIQKVWKMVQTKPVPMTKPEFTTIMYILQQIKKGKEVPASLPASFKQRLTGQSAEPEPQPEPEQEEEKADVDWTPDDNVVNKLKTLFNKKTNGESTIDIPSAIKLFQKTNCEKSDIAKICKMVVGGKPSTLSEGQFVVIMYICQKVGKGASIPAMVPPQLQRLI